MQPARRDEQRGRVQPRHDDDLIRTTARCSEIAQVRCKCLAQVDIAAVRRISQQVNAFLCQNLRSEPFPYSHRKFVDGWNARYQRDAWSSSCRPEVELIPNAFIWDCFYAVR